MYLTCTLKAAHCAILSTCLFKPGRFTITALWDSLVTKIEGAQLGQEITLCAFLEGAFHITYISIERADTSKSMDLAIMEWIKAMLSTCRVMAHLREVAEIAVAYRCHQRSLQVGIL